MSSPHGDHDDRSDGSGPADGRDPHDPRFELDRLDNLTLLALGEVVDASFATHQRGCPQCQGELDALAHTVAVVRETDENSDARPPASVWAGISSELGLTAHGQTRRPTAGHVRRWRYALVAIAAAVLLVVGGAGGFLLARHGDRATVAAASHAILSAQAGGPKNVTGAATVHTTDQGRQLSITSDGLPLRQGYYEVWLYNPASGGMQPVGALGDNGSGTFTIAGSIDLRSYDVIDVSAQDYGGSTVVHQQSVLQGPLTQ